VGHVTEDGQLAFLAGILGHAHRNSILKKANLGSRLHVQLLVPQDHLAAPTLPDLEAAEPALQLVQAGDVAGLPRQGQGVGQLDEHKLTGLEFEKLLNCWVLGWLFLDDWSRPGLDLGGVVLLVVVAVKLTHLFI